MDYEFEEWRALSAREPGNLTEKGRSRLAELENKFGSTVENYKEKDFF